MSRAAIATARRTIASVPGAVVTPTRMRSAVSQSSFGWWRWRCSSSSSSVSSAKKRSASSRKRDQVVRPKEVRERLGHLFRRVDVAVRPSDGEAARVRSRPTRSGRPCAPPSPAPARGPGPRDPLHRIGDALEVLNVDRRDDVDVIVEQLEHVLPSLLVATEPGHVGVGQFVDEGDLGLATRIASRSISSNVEPRYSTVLRGTTSRPSSRSLGLSAARDTRRSRLRRRCHAPSDDAPRPASRRSYRPRQRHRGRYGTARRSTGRRPRTSGSRLRRLVAPVVTGWPPCLSTDGGREAKAMSGAGSPVKYRRRPRVGETDRSPTVPLLSPSSQLTAPRSAAARRCSCSQEAQLGAVVLAGDESRQSRHGARPVALDRPSGSGRVASAGGDVRVVAAARGGDQVGGGIDAPGLCQ